MKMHREENLEARSYLGTNDGLVCRRSVCFYLFQNKLWPCLTQNVSKSDDFGIIMELQFSTLFLDGLQVYLSFIRGEIDHARGYK